MQKLRFNLHTHSKSFKMDFLLGLSLFYVCVGVGIHKTRFLDEKFLPLIILLITVTRLPAAPCNKSMGCL